MLPVGSHPILPTPGPLLSLIITYVLVLSPWACISHALTGRIMDFPPTPLLSFRIAQHHRALIHKYLLTQPSCCPHQPSSHSTSLQVSRLLILLLGNHLHIPTCFAHQARDLRLRGKFELRRAFKYPQLIPHCS